ncbi:MAG TPA: NifU family protein [Gemmatimonadaceae bacterium]|nr:NifU family protein [Gemmatimonadaceae bacterium]
MSVLGRRRARREAIVVEQIDLVLAEVGPLLRMDHYRIEVAEYPGTEGRLTLRIDGSCPDCDLSPATFIPAIEAHLRQRVPEVREVSVIGQ